MQKIEKIRNTNVEILRFTLMIAIVLWHVIVHGFDFVDGKEGMASYVGCLPNAFLWCALLSPATYCFVFISGYYGIHFSVRKLLSLLLSLLLVAVGCASYKYICGGGSLYSIYASFIPLAFNKWWFITAYVTLYILSPFINKALLQLTKRQVLILLLCVYGILLYRWVLLVPNAGSSLSGLLFVYILARCTAMYNLEFSRRQSVVVYFASAVLLMVLACVLFYATRNALAPKEAQRIVFQLYAYCNPLIVAMAAALFFFVRSFPVKYYLWLNRILSANLFIYLFTQGVGLIDYHSLTTLLFTQPLLFVGYVMSIVLIALLAGHIVSFISRGIVSAGLIAVKSIRVIKLIDKL